MPESRSQPPRCICRTPVGTQCTARPTQEDMLCDDCRDTRMLTITGRSHYCGRSSTPDENTDYRADTP